MLPSPVPKKSNLTLVVILVIVITVIVLAGIGAYLLGRSLTINTPIITQKKYSGNLSVASWDTRTTYQGQVPSGAYFLIVNATFNNTGDAFTGGRYDWAIRSVDGFFIDFPSSNFYVDMAFVKGQIVTKAVVFDLTSYANPAKISLDLPDGKTLNAPL